MRHPNSCSRLILKPQSKRKQLSNLAKSHSEAVILLLFIHCYCPHCEWEIAFTLVPCSVVWFLVQFEFSNHHFEEERELVA